MKCCNCNCEIEHSVAIAMEPNRVVFACSVPCAEEYNKGKELNESSDYIKPQLLTG